MDNWKNKIENDLKVFHHEIQEGNSIILHKQTVAKAESEYEKYKVIQGKNYVSDLDRLLG